MTCMILSHKFMTQLKWSFIVKMEYYQYDFKLPRTPSWEINKFPVHDVYDDFLSQIYDLIKMQDKCKNKVY